MELKNTFFCKFSLIAFWSPAMRLNCLILSNKLSPIKTFCLSNTLISLCSLLFLSLLFRIARRAAYSHRWRQWIWRECKSGWADHRRSEAACLHRRHWRGMLGNPYGIQCVDLLQTEEEKRAQPLHSLICIHTCRYACTYHTKLHLT